MSALDRAALRALAEAATQPRSAFDGQFWDFHNAVTPAAVLALLDDVERLRSCLETLNQMGGLGHDVHARIDAALEPRA